MEIFLKNPLFVGLRIPDIVKTVPLEAKAPLISKHALVFMKSCLIYNQEDRATSRSLLNDAYFNHDGWGYKLDSELGMVFGREEENKKKKSKIQDHVQKGGLKSNALPNLRTQIKPLNQQLPFHYFKNQAIKNITFPKIQPNNERVVSRGLEFNG